jgi:hypothetical protein
MPTTSCCCLPRVAEAGVVEERWSAALAPPTPGGPSILTVAAHTPGEAVFSPARVVGSGQIKFKYLNPNTLLVAVGWPSAAAAERAGGEPSLTVVLLDAVTGRVLHSQTHQVAASWTGGSRGHAGRLAERSRACRARAVEASFSFSPPL